MTKTVVIGGTGLIGSRLVSRLTEQGQEAVPASPNSGVNTITGEGLDEVLTGAKVVVDVSNSPSFEEDAVLNFFTTSTSNIVSAATAAGVGHYVALSVVGTDRLAQSPYFRAKIAQEQLIEDSGIAYSIVHATQFFEFVRSIANDATIDDTVHLSHALIQPIAADDVASAVARTVVGEPVNGIVEVAGPQPFGLDELIRTSLTLDGDPRSVVTDPQAPYFGALLEERTLLPDPDAQIAGTSFEEWAARPTT